MSDEKHTCPPDPFSELFHQMVDDGDGEGPYDVGAWGLECAPHATFFWDQWMVCDIQCYHGCVVGTACGINFTESFTRAVEQFNAYDHTRPCREKRDDESYSEYRERANRGPYDVEAGEGA